MKLFERDICRYLHTTCNIISSGKYQSGIINVFNSFFETTTSSELQNAFLLSELPPDPHMDATLSLRIDGEGGFRSLV